MRYQYSCPWCSCFPSPAIWMDGVRLTRSQPFLNRIDETAMTGAGRRRHPPAVHTSDSANSSPPAPRPDWLGRRADGMPCHEERRGRALVSLHLACVVLLEWKVDQIMMTEYDMQSVKTKWQTKTLKNKNNQAGTRKADTQDTR